MSNFKQLLPTAIFTFVLLLFVLGVGAVGLDWLQPRLPCLSAEKSYWRSAAPGQTFDMVSAYFWSSLCRPHAPPVVISASEGTGDPSFPEILNQRWHTPTDQFVSAHRGLKTLGYMLANDIHPERLRGLRILGLINPVYFSFAAHTDSSSIRLNAISNLAYILRVPTLVQKWDEFLLDSFYISAKDYWVELQKFRTPGETRFIKPAGEITPVTDDLFQPNRNMLKERAEYFKSFTSRFESTAQPSRLLFETTVKFVKDHPDVPICLVLLPTNTKNLDYFERDSKAIVADLNQMFAEVPAEAGVNLQRMNEEPKIFLDSMHLTALGKLRVLEEVLKTPCGQKVIAQ